MKLIEEMCDQYNLRARVLPAFLLVLPVTLGVVAVFPAAYQGPVGIAAGILAFIVLYQLSDWVRERGLAAQNELYRQWGGKPSVLLLSYFQTVIAPDTLVRRHNKLRELERIKGPVPPRLNPDADVRSLFFQTLQQRRK